MPRKDRLTVSGSGYLTFREYTVTGREQTFRRDTYGQNDRFQNRADLLISGPVWKNLYVHAQVYRDSYGITPVRPVFRFMWLGHDAQVTVGDISPNLGQGNEFVIFSGRSLRGVQIEGQLGRQGRFLTFGSLIASRVQTESFPGDGTAGPYQLKYKPIVQGSEVVYVDGVRQRFGLDGDYTMDYINGWLTFNGTRIIAPTQTIEISYETYGTGETKDQLFGIRLDSSLTPRLTLGLTYLGQRAGTRLPPGTVQQEQRGVDVIVSPTNSQGPFYVRTPGPMVPESETVTVNGQAQVRNVHYFINYETAALNFVQPIPEGTEIVVRFKYLEEFDRASGDRGILGLDGSLTLGRGLTINAQYAISDGAINTRGGYGFGGLGGYGGYYGGYGSYGSYGGYGSYSGSSGWGGYSTYGGSYPGLFRQASLPPRTGRGEALRLRATGQWKAFNFSAEYKNIGDNFTPVDSTGFFYNERGFNFNLAYSPSPKLNVYYRYDRYERPESSGLPAETAGRLIATQSSGGLTWRFGSASQLTLSHNTYGNLGTLRETSLSRDSLSISHRFGSFNFLGSFDRSVNFSATHQTGEQTTPGGFSSLYGEGRSETRSGRLALSYDASNGRFGLRADYAFSEALSSRACTRSESANFGVNFVPTEMVSLNISHRLSKSRSTANPDLIVTGLEGTPSSTPEATAGTPPETSPNRQYFGGFSNNPFGGYGGYGGYSGFSSFGTYGYGSNTNSVSTAVALNFTPPGPWSFSLSYDKQYYEGRFAGAGNQTEGLSFQFGCQLAQNLNFGGSYSLQGLRYLDQNEVTHTNIFNLNLSFQPSSQVRLNLDFQDMRTDSKEGNRPLPLSTGLGAGTGLNPLPGSGLGTGVNPNLTYSSTPNLGTTGDSTTYGGYATGYGSSYGYGSYYGGGYYGGYYGGGMGSLSNRFLSYGIGLEYRLPGRRGHTFFVRFRSDTSEGGFQSFNRNLLSLGLNFQLTDIIGLRISFDRRGYVDPRDHDNNYTSNMFNAELGVRF